MCTLYRQLTFQPDSTGSDCKANNYLHLFRMIRLLHDRNASLEFICIFTRAKPEYLELVFGLGVTIK